MRKEIWLLLLLLGTGEACRTANLLFPPVAAIEDPTPSLTQRPTFTRVPTSTMTPPPIETATSAWTATRPARTATVRPTTPKPSPSRAPAREFPFKSGREIERFDNCGVPHFDGMVQDASGQPLDGIHVLYTLNNQFPTVRVTGDGKSPGEVGFQLFGQDQIHNRHTLLFAPIDPGKFNANEPNTYAYDLGNPNAPIPPAFLARPYIIPYQDCEKSARNPLGAGQFYVVWERTQ